MEFILTGIFSHRCAPRLVGLSLLFSQGDAEHRIQTIEPICRETQGGIRCPSQEVRDFRNASPFSNRGTRLMQWQREFEEP